MAAARALGRPRKLIEERAAARKAAIDQKKTEAAHSISAERRHRAEPVSQTRAADRHWSLLRRLPYALAHWVLGLIPLVVFFVVAIVLLNAAGGRAAPFYGPTLLAVSAYATTRFVLSVIQLMASPLGQGLRLMHISDSMAAFLNGWLRWIVIVAVFGTAIADISLETGATRNTHDTLTKLVALAVHVMLLFMVFRSRKATAAAIRGTAADSPELFGWRSMLADSWLFVATFLIVAAWLLWSAGTENGFQHVLHVFGWSAAVIVGASLVSIFVLGAIDRAFISNRENRQQQFGQTRRADDPESEAAPKSTYHMLVYRAVSSIIGLVALILLLQVWGVDTHAWFGEGSVGRRLASALATIAVTCILALAAWEALNKAICNRIDQWSEEGDIARAARLRTLVPMLRACLFFAIGTVVVLAALHQLGINIGPLLAGASILGVALGFGSQKLVQDFITGIFLLMENAIQVGDFITVADVSGSVEYLSVRTVRLRGAGWLASRGAVQFRFDRDQHESRPRQCRGPGQRQGGLGRGGGVCRHPRGGRGNARRSATEGPDPGGPGNLGRGSGRWRDDYRPRANTHAGQGAVAGAARLQLADSGALPRTEHPVREPAGTSVVAQPGLLFRRPNAAAARSRTAGRKSSFRLTGKQPCARTPSTFVPCLHACTRVAA